MKREPAANARDLLRNQQDHAAHLLEHIDELDRRDRAILHGALRLGMSTADLAAASGLQPRTVRQRIARLSRRIASPEFQYVLAHRGSWPARRRAILERVILRGRSQREVAEELDISIYRVRQECERIRHAIELTREHGPRRWTDRHILSAASSTSGRPRSRVGCEG